MQRFTQAVFRAFKPSLDATAATLPDLDTYWEKNLAPAVKCSEYLNDYLFPQVSAPKTLIIDGMDRVLGQETWEGFSGFLRAFFEEKMKKVSLNQKITLGVAKPSDLIKEDKLPEGKIEKLSYVMTKIMLEQEDAECFCQGFVFVNENLMGEKLLQDNPPQFRQIQSQK